jgi:hypothetical protein
MMTRLALISEKRQEAIQVFLKRHQTAVIVISVLSLLAICGVGLWIIGSANSEKERNSDAPISGIVTEKIPLIPTSNPIRYRIVIDTGTADPEGFELENDEIADSLQVGQTYNFIVYQPVNRNIRMIRSVEKTPK